MYVSKFLGLDVTGHLHFDFVDTYLKRDTKLFLDPCAIENGDNDWCRNATAAMNSFFDSLFAYSRRDAQKLFQLFGHAGEQNATKLGYGTGINGKGKTAKGLFESLSELRTLANVIPTISRPEDLPVLVKKFDKDCMSDLLTNILHEPLNSFTASQMEKYGRKPDKSKTFFTWDANVCDWVKVTRPSWVFNGKELLLVPKDVVRKNFIFRTEHYLRHVIITRMQNEPDKHDLKKKDIMHNLSLQRDYWRYTTAIEYTKKHPDALDAYHTLLPKIYGNRGRMTDEELDTAVYLQGMGTVA
jgi:hypothetical protein